MATTETAKTTTNPRHDGASPRRFLQYGAGPQDFRAARAGPNIFMVGTSMAAHVSGVAALVDSAAGGTLTMQILI